MNVRFEEFLNNLTIGRVGVKNVYLFKEMANLIKLYDGRRLFQYKKDDFRFQF